jgi:hypothetical protein
MRPFSEFPSMVAIDKLKKKLIILNDRRFYFLSTAIVILIVIVTTIKHSDQKNEIYRQKRFQLQSLADSYK